jgi:hypothetical protein
LISVEVAPEQKTYNVHKSFLIRGSNFFRLALQSEWIENTAQVVKLPEVEPSVFNIYVNWLYSRELMLGMGRKELYMRSVRDCVFDCYLHGDRLLDADFKDAVSDSLVMMYLKENSDGKTCIPNSRTIQRVYRNTKKGSKLRLLVVHRKLASQDPTNFDLEHGIDFLLDFAQYQTSKDRESLAFVAARCYFHEHEAGDENCYRTKFSAGTNFTEE